MKNQILDLFKLESFTWKNKEAVQNMVSLIEAAFNEPFYCIEFLYKYGSFNDIIIHVFKDEADLQDSAQWDNKEESADTKWYTKKFYSTGIVNTFNPNL